MKKSFFAFRNYKSLVLNLLAAMPREGYGQFRKIAEHLNVNSVIVSQIFKGDRNLTLDQALELGFYFGFSKLETEYFLVLVQIERSGSHRLKVHLENQLQEIREKSQELKERLPHDKVLTEETKAIFYSTWYYSGIRLLTGVEGMNSVDAIAEHLALPRATVKRVAEFLVAHGLCLEENGKLRMGPQLTHLEASSPLLTRHLTNWRLRGLQNLEPPSSDELFYSAPMVLSTNDVMWVRERLIEVIEAVLARVKNSESERLTCLNIDWFDFRGRR